jgi:hypothetical protein
LLLANGASIETVDNLDIEDARHLYSALRLGLWGPFGQSHQSYFQMAKLNEGIEIQRAVAMGKKFKPTPFARYHEIFPTMSEAETLGLGSIARAAQKEKSMAMKAVIALGGDAPAWIKNAV